MHEKLSHLSETDLRELLRRYYDPEKAFTVTQIVADFHIDARPSDLASLLPDTVHPEVCPYCTGVNLRSKAASRSGYGHQAPACPSCGHKGGRYCSCANCQQAAAIQSRERERVYRQIITQHYGPHSWANIPPVDELSLEDAIYLKTIVTHKASEDLREVDPTAITQTHFAPGDRFIWEVLRHLYHYTKAIAPSPISDLTAFSFDEDPNESPSFYLSKVRWLLLPSLSQTERITYLRDVDTRLRALASADDVEFSEHDLWHTIVKYEAIEYYEHKLSEVNVELDKIGDRTQAVFDDLVNRFSLAQIYHIIYVTVRNTHHYTTQQRIPHYQAKNMYVGAVEKNANKYEAEGWLKDYRRDFNCPQSTLSAIFFDFYLGIGASYFSTKLPALP